MRINSKPSNIVNDFVGELLKSIKPKSTLFCGKTRESVVDVSEEKINEQLREHVKTPILETRLVFNSKKGEIDRSIFFLDILDDDIVGYDFIIGDLPIGMEKIQCDGFDEKITTNHCAISKLLEKNNRGIFFVEPMFGVSANSKSFLDSLEKRGLFINAIIESPDGIWKPETSIQPSLAIFSREKREKIFIASLSDETDNKKALENYIDWKSGNNLIEGDIISIDDFRGFENYRINQKINRLKTKYKEYRQIKLKDFLIEINSTKDVFEEMRSACYVPRSGNLNHIFCDINKIEKKNRFFFQLIINEAITRPEYLRQYLLTEMGQLSLKSLLNGSSIFRINKIDFQDILIPVPDINTQDRIIDSYNILERMNNEIALVQNDLALNPDNATVVIKKMTNALNSLSQLSKEDKVMQLIRCGESLTIEFKETFETNKHTGKKDDDIRVSALKNIVGFMNKKGGNLLIGVADDGEIKGVESDHFQNLDKYLLNFKNVVKERIGSELGDYIEYELINVSSKNVLLVECAASMEPVYLDKKDFYVRTNPAVDKLEGPAMINYIKNHFKN